IKQADTFPKQDGDKMQVDFIDRSGFEVLLGDIGASNHTDVFLTRSSFGLIESAFQPLRDKGVHGSCWSHPFWYRMGEDKDRKLTSPRVLSSPPGNLRHVSARHHGPRGLHHFIKHQRVTLGFPPKHPGMQPLASLAQGLFWTNVRADDQPIG